MGGGGMGGSTMMISSVMGVCLSLVAAIAIYFLVFSGGDSSSSAPDPVIDTADMDATPVSDDLSGIKLITVGTFNMGLKSGSCGNKSIRFNPDSTDKWQWRLIRDRKDWVDAQGNTYPTYQIESFSQNFKSCPQRFLTAPGRCTAPPFLAKRRAGNAQRWILVSDGSGYQIRSMMCAAGRSTNSYLVGDGYGEYDSKGNLQPSPGGFDSSGSTFSITTP